MASLKEMRDRIGSVKATQKITKAMQMVAAAKLKRAQEQAENARPYASRMASVIANLAAGVGDDGPRLMTGTGADQKHLVVVATADKGLAGGFSTNVIRAARDHINSLIANGKDVEIVAVGRKSRDQLTRLFGDKVVKTFELSEHKTVGLHSAQPIAELLAEKFEADEADKVTLFYSQFKSVISQVPSSRQLAPAEVDADASADAGALYEYEPSDPAAAQPDDADPGRPSGKPGRLLRRPDGCDGQRHAQRRRPHQRLDAAVQPFPPGPDHHRADRDHRRR